MRFYATLFLLLALVSKKAGFAQSFRDPTVPQQFQTSTVYINGIQAGDPNNYVNTASLPVYGMGFTCNLYRVKGFPLTGYVDVYAGTSESQLNITLLCTSTSRANINSSTQWIAIPNSNYEYANVGGSFNLTAAQAGSNPGLYAVYFDANSVPPTSPPTPARGETSIPVRLARYVTTVPTPTPPAPTPYTYEYYMPCGGDGTAICSNQTVGFGGIPQLLHGRVVASDGQQPWQSYLAIAANLKQPAWANGTELELVKWQASADNVTWVDVTLSGTQDQNYQPSRCFANTYFRRLSTHEVKGRREDWYTSNTVTITVLPCDSDVYIQNNESLYATTVSGANLSAGYDIPGSNMPVGNVTVQQRRNVTFVARGDIRLLPGFSVEFNADFSAFTANGNNVCSTPTHRDIYPNEESSISQSSTMSSSGNSEKMESVLAYPNPVSDILIIPSGTQSVVLLNGQGQAVRTANETSQLTVQDLPEGLYNLQMYQNGKLTNQHIEIKH